MNKGDWLTTTDGDRGRILSWKERREWYGHGALPRVYQEILIELPDGRRRIVLPDQVRDTRPAGRRYQ